jgi:hypothetical protein
MLLAVNRHSYDEASLLLVIGACFYWRALMA